MPEPRVGQPAPASQTLDPEEGVVVVVVEEGAMDHHNNGEAVTVTPDTPPPLPKAEVCQLVVEEEEDESVSGEVQGCLEGCRFMEVSRVVRLLTESRWALEGVPPGLKEYVYFVVNNENNVLRRSRKKRSDFPDDCGVWLSGSGSTPRTTLLPMPDGDLKQVFLRQGRYYTERVARRRKEYVPVVPQPSPDTLLELHRYYVSLKMDTSYRKRVSWLGPGGSGGHGPVAVVEYIGKFPGFSSHGKASGSKEYVRPAPCLQEDMASLLQDGLSPSTVHHQLLQRYQRLHGLRDVRQVRDSRRRFLRQQQQEAAAPLPPDPTLLGGSLTCLLEMVQDGDPLVRAAWHLPGRPASVALCTEDQLRDLCTLCLPGHTLLGVDRRLAVCGFTVTPTGYRHLALVRPQDGCAPVFLGPVLVHQGPDLGEYAAFLSHLKVLLGETDTSHLVLGTEDIPALAQAVQLALPGTAHTVLSAHLARAAGDWLRNDGLCEEDFSLAMAQVAGPDGLLAAPNSEVLQQRGEQLLQRWGSVAPGFSVHLRTQLLPVLQGKVVESPRACQLDQAWTGALQDSPAHLLEVEVDWTSLSLLKFVESVRWVVEKQAGDVVKALQGEGPYRLAPQVAKLGMSKEAWESLTPQQQQQAQDNLMELREAEWSHTTTTTTTSWWGKVEPHSPPPLPPPGEDRTVASLAVKVEEPLWHNTGEEETPPPTTPSQDNTPMHSGAPTPPSSSIPTPPTPTGTTQPTTTRGNTTFTPSQDNKRKGLTSPASSHTNTPLTPEKKRMKL